MNITENKQNILSIIEIKMHKELILAHRLKVETVEFIIKFDKASELSEPFKT